MVLGTVANGAEVWADACATGLTINGSRKFDSTGGQCTGTGASATNNFNMLECGELTTNPGMSNAVNLNDPDALKQVCDYLSNGDPKNLDGVDISNYYQACSATNSSFKVNLPAGSSVKCANLVGAALSIGGTADDTCSILGHSTYTAATNFTLASGDCPSNVADKCSMDKPLKDSLVDTVQRWTGNGPTSLPQSTGSTCYPAGKTMASSDVGSALTGKQQPKPGDSSDGTGGVGSASDQTGLNP